MNWKFRLSYSLLKTKLAYVAVHQLVTERRVAMAACLPACLAQRGLCRYFRDETLAPSTRRGGHRTPLEDAQVTVDISEYSVLAQRALLSSLVWLGIRASSRMANLLFRANFAQHSALLASRRAAPKMARACALPSPFLWPLRAQAAVSELRAIGDELRAVRRSGDGGGGGGEVGGSGGRSDGGGRGGGRARER
eukprot:4879123-Pleurochrysis_carterae.AAC.4